MRASPAAIPRSEYDFLLGCLVDRATLDRAEAISARTGDEPHEILIANGWVKGHDYYRLLAERCGVAFCDDLTGAVAPSAKATPRDCLAQGLIQARSGELLLAPGRMRPNTLQAMLAQLTERKVALAEPQALRRAIYRHFQSSFAQAAVEALHQRHPERSARSKLALWQRLAMSIAVVAIAAGGLLAPFETMRVISLALALAFVPIVGLRLIALRDVWRRRDDRTAPTTPCIPDAELPVYTILVPLFREANVLPALTRVLAQLDYPAAKLDIKLILEHVDRETIETARALDLPGIFEIVVVPELEPRTKPKALNYALPLARGDYVAIYDAEDRPEPDQLRKALAAFRAGPPELACVQARLDLYNPRDNWLTKQFAIEYCALFGGLLPTLDRLKLPIPLGGTSNHFKISALKWLMAWDPFNVTEDADLGMRLVRGGYRCAMLDSATYEEAPSRFKSWRNQRTRWMKGYVQTYLVHMRAPWKLWHELGPRSFLGFQVMIGGTVLSALVHPWVYGLLAFDLMRGVFLERPDSLLGLPFWLIAWCDLLVGYAAVMGVGLLAVKARGHAELVRQVALMPFYWLLISVAAYRALWQFMRARFEWEKTEHGLALTEQRPGP